MTTQTIRFDDLRLIDPLLRAVRDEGYTQPTPIQQQAIPHVLEGRDLLGCAQTGTGKTAAFALPILQRLATIPRPADAPRHRGVPPVRVLVLTPTRELAAQIGESFSTYGRHTKLRNAVIFGGVGQAAQERAVASGLDILVATPGRLLDLMSQRLVSLAGLEIFVLDEADRMLDMGFIHDVRKVIAALPAKRQTLFFSATMPDEITALAHSILRDPVRVEVTPVASTAEKIEQSLYFVEKGDKRALLEHVLRANKSITRALVFTRTKHGANRVAEQLGRAGIHAEAIHGNKSQNARERALSNFKSGATRVLVATDIAARGIDIDGISHVVNYDLPNVPESYVHRIGRTARAGASGIAISFCDTEERAYLRDIQRLIRQHVPVVSEHPFRSSASPPPVQDLNARHGGGGAGGGGGYNAPRAPQPQHGGRRPGQPQHNGGRFGGQGGGQPQRSAGSGGHNGQRTSGHAPPPRSSGGAPQHASHPSGGHGGGHAPRNGGGQHQHSAPRGPAAR